MKKIAFIGCLFLVFACQSKLQKAETASKTQTLVSGKTAGFDPNKNAYFGDLHVHSSWSFDAFIYNVRATPADAYKYGRGEPIIHYVQGKIQLQRPLDFMAVTDHAEYMGIMNQMLEPSNPLAKLEIAERINSPDKKTNALAFQEIGRSIGRNQPIEELIKEDIIKSTWQKIIETANQFNNPGKFTTFIGYEWTSSPSQVENTDIPFARNLHRNVIYKGDKVSTTPFSSFHSRDPEQLWEWMEKEKKSGIDLLAIPHNGNMSDGLMYPSKTYDGRPIDEKYAKLRLDNEPINEVVQIKGQSMTHPLLSNNDEFADFELFSFVFTTTGSKKSNPKGSTVSEAFKNGLEIENKLGVNPFKFGVIGSSDGHNAAGAVEENNYFGKFGNLDGDPTARLDAATGKDFLHAKEMSAAGLAGVWATENTRDALYESIQRKEVFATSGTRLKVRFFASFDTTISFNGDWVADMYKKAVPMGGDLAASSRAKSPTFAIWAVKDPEGANLDRIQVVKVWLDAKGTAQEKIIDAVWSDNRSMKNGRLEHVGNTVNVKEATYTNTIGAVELKTIWTDPSFDKSQNAMYYLRVLEIPTPRWSTFDAKKLNMEVPKDMPTSIQERAWSSPIWYNQQ